ncbi:single-stranded DNA-binding protein [Curtobacterium flaccumfaciens]|uniref:Single-stranded DNA-binding protein n=1 Tax=Curtobacterium flaccumfaciens TaxID=2035 RepID=A0A4R6DN75_9MICO|nr:single-stranded DNA-binding protein [Curtobacterium flaccumfaciens]TDN46243.1 single-stranded DNA-binding protein [Curtobacterium flaccumfaciens]
MNDTITVCGIIATEPRHLVTDTGIAITSMRLASPSRRWDRATSTWTNGATNWYSVTAFRTLAANVYKSVKKGDRIVVTGRVRIRTWERDGRGGTSVEIDAEGLGHDLAWGISNWIRVPRHASESAAAPGTTPSVDPRTGEVLGGRGGATRSPGGTDLGSTRAGDTRTDGTQAGDTHIDDTQARHTHIDHTHARDTHVDDTHLHDPDLGDDHGSDDRDVRVSVLGPPEYDGEDDAHLPTTDGRDHAAGPDDADPAEPVAA